MASTMSAKGVTFHSEYFDPHWQPDDPAKLAAAIEADELRWRAQAQKRISRIGWLLLVRTAQSQRTVKTPKLALGYT